MRTGDLVTIDSIPAIFKIIFLSRTDVMLIGVDELGRAIANLDTRGRIIVRRSITTPYTNPDQEILL